LQEGRAATDRRRGEPLLTERVAHGGHRRRGNRLQFRLGYTPRLRRVRCRRAPRIARRGVDAAIRVEDHPPRRLRLLDGAAREADSRGVLALAQPLHGALLRLLTNASKTAMK